MAGEQIGEAFIAVRPNTQGFQNELNGSVSKSIGNVAGLIAAGFAANKVKDFFGAAVAEATEAQKVSAQTAAVIKSTGGAAKISAKDVGTLANRLSDLAAVDDEVVQNAENVLLTFTNIRNETGKGNRIFDLATKASLNMSKALGTDLQGAAMAVGKALNDPIQGVSALRRVGVQLSDQQEQQVKDFMAVGDSMSAQKVILDELNKEFGGSAAAQATPAERAKVAWDNLKESLGTALLPVLKKLTEVLIPIIKYLEKHKTLVLVLAGIVGGVLVAAFVAWTVSLFAAGGALAFLLSPITLVVLAIAAIIAIIVILIRHWDDVERIAGEVWSAVKGAVEDAMNAVIGAINSAIDWVKTHWTDILGTLLLGPFWIFRDEVWGIIQAVIGFFEHLVKKVTGLIGQIADKAGSIGGKILDPLGIGGKIGGLLGFADGGVVPGPIGAPRLAVVHGGEEIRNPAQRAQGGGDTIHLTVVSPSSDPVSFAMQTARTLRIARWAVG